MFKIYKQELEWGGRLLTLETGKIARQADGAVVATYGETSVLCTAVSAKSVKPGADFFPLTVHYIEKAFAAGKIPGGFFKREGKPSEKEVLTSRLIDRPIRPLFPEGFFNETLVMCTLLSHDLETNPDIVAMIGASAALAISGVPFLGPIGAAKVGYKDGQFILNPTYDQLKESDLDLMVAGTEEGVLMVESEAKQLSEQTMLDAVTFGHQEMQSVIKMILKLKKQAGKDVWEISDKTAAEKALYAQVKKMAEKDLRKAYAIKDKQKRVSAIDEIRGATVTALMTEDMTENHIDYEFKNLEKEIVRGDILKSGIRIDGRDTTTIRPIVCEAGWIPRTHGSALFTRGETQAIVATTLGTGQDEQIIDALEGETRERFMLHYNFPPYSVGEAGRVSPPGRREIGHGKLAWRSIRPLLPSKEKFPYTIRVVSEITESNGSSSMATVCGTSLSLMDAGVPMEKPVAGIAMGLIKEGKKFAVLSDILGDEDHLGDMDFKVAGTDSGVTALQMDIKITSITREIMETALHQAKEGRLHILGEMKKALTSSREDVSQHAPRIKTIVIPKDKIRDIIGPGGKIIREICETTGARIDIAEDGTVDVAGLNEKMIEDALARIRMITAEPEIGTIYQGTVQKIMEFGAVVAFMGERTGLVHISQLAAERVGKVEDVLQVGEKIYVKLIGMDDRGKFRLSRKAVDQETGVDFSIAP